MATEAGANDRPPQPPFVVRFYGQDQAEDGEGRTLEEILKFDDHSLEYHHDYIQVLFPLPERSPINPSAPVLTKSVQEAFQQDDKLQDSLYRAFKRMASFYAFDVSGPKENPTLKPKTNFKRLASQSWLTGMDHNHLRITRIIRCLRVLALGQVASKFYETLKANDEGGRVSPRSRMYWERAAKRLLHLPPDESDDNAQGIAWLRQALSENTKEGESQAAKENGQVDVKDDEKTNAKEAAEVSAKEDA